MDNPDIIIPADIQWSLLERYVQGFTVEKIRKNTESKELGLLDVVRKEQDMVFVLGRKLGQEQRHWDVLGPYYTPLTNLYMSVSNALYGDLQSEELFEELDPAERKFSILASALFSFFVIGLPFLLYNLRPSFRNRAEKTKQYADLRDRFLKENIADLEKIVSPIRVCQGSINDAPKELGRPVELVDTKTQETYIHEKNLFWMKARAAFLGADAIIHYQAASASGTPVKYADKG